MSSPFRRSGAITLQLALQEGNRGTADRLKVLARQDCRALDERPLSLHGGVLDVVTKGGHEAFSHLPVARLELLDERGIAMLNRGLQRSDPEMPVLLMEFHSSTPGALQAEVVLLEEIVRECGAVAVQQAETRGEQAALWEIRHKAYWTFVNHYPGRVSVHFPNRQK